MNAMKNTRIVKVLSLSAVAALALLLTGCVVPPDDINAAGGYTVNNGGNFQDITPPTRVPTEVPVTQVPTTRPTDNPINDVWGGNAAGGQSQQPGGTDHSEAAATSPNPGSIISQMTPSIITTTNAPSGGSGSTTTTSPSSSVLRKGSTGSDVKKMQQKLKDLGYLKGSADGDFGDATETAVKAFQRQNGLTADGVAGSKTLNKLYSSSAVKAPSAATNTPRKTATPTPRATQVPDTDYYLEIGSSGSKVRTLQNRLIELGWLGGKANGEYGDATAYAVTAFQKRYSSLYNDGVAGPSTLKIMYANGAAKANEPVASIGETLQFGSEGDEVKALQTRLKALGFLSGKADGDFGEATKAAVIAFQTANGLKADGRAGNSTLNKIYSENAKDADSLRAEEEKPTSKPTNKPTSKPTDKPTTEEEQEDVIINGYVVLKEGSKGDEVKDLQRALKNRGYFSNSITGYYGENTAAAVMAFQSANGLKADGVAGPATQTLLFNTQSTSAYATLEYGDSGSAVKNMQYALKELGYYDGSVNGYYSSTTRDAVRAFQIQNDITPVNGVAGNKTLQRLYSGSALAAAAQTDDFTTLSKGDKGDLVVQMQEALVILGYLAEPTGYYDNATVEAVKNFQRRNGISQTGTAGKKTLTLLYYGEPVTAY